VDAVDVRGLPLSPEEAFVLSRIDGKSERTAIAIATGISPDRVGSHLQRLMDLGAIRSAGASKAGAVNGAGKAHAKPHVAADSGAQTAKETPKEEPKPAKARSPELDESLSISLELQQRILELCARLADLDHFELLGIPMNAERAAVKRAYFSMIGTFHPDTYFGKRLGSFTKRMEKIFQRLTEAHDVLSNRQTRDEYEAYLAALGRTRELDEIADSPPPSVEELEQLLQQAEEALRPKQASPPPRAKIAMQPPPLPKKEVSRRPVEMVDDPVARRQALARKLGLVPANSSVPAEPPDDEAVREQAARHSAAAKDLHRRYKHRKEAIRDQRVARFAKAAEDAIAAGNNVSALNTLKIARSLSGGDITTVERLEELEKKVGATAADSYLERARYEESNGHYEEAARSYTRSAQGRPSADVLRSAAECYLKAGVELRQASELARQAVQIAPDRADLRLSLAKIYEAAGMQQSAVRELERALELNPDSDRIKQWLKRSRRGGV
jgi:curved DNA-binding protein CbpA